MTPSAWIDGELEADFVGEPRPAPPDAINGESSRFRIRLTAGRLRAARRLAEPPPPAMDEPTLSLASLGPVFVHLDADGSEEIVACTLHDLELRRWSTFELAESEGLAYGRLRGHVSARLPLTDEVVALHPEPLALPARDATALRPEDEAALRNAPGCAPFAALGLTWGILFVAVAVILPSIVLAGLAAAAVVAGLLALLR